MLAGSKFLAAVCGVLYKGDREDASMPELPEELRRAIEAGTLTSEQVRQLIELEAKALGLTFEQAKELAKKRTLPGSSIGSDLQMLFGLLPVAA